MQRLQMQDKHVQKQAALKSQGVTAEAVRDHVPLQRVCKAPDPGRHPGGDFL